MGTSMCTSRCMWPSTMVAVVLWAPCSVTVAVWAQGPWGAFTKEGVLCPP